MATPLFDPALLKKATGMLNILDQDVLVNILMAIHARGSMTVTEIYIHLRTHQPIASQYLRKLREAQFVTASRKGKNVYYAVNQSRLEQVQQALDSFIRQTPDWYLASYNLFVKQAINQFAPEPRVETFEGLLSWTGSFAQGLRLFHEALEEKATEIIAEAKKNKRLGKTRIQAELDEIKKTAIQKYWRRHQL